MKNWYYCSAKFLSLTSFKFGIVNKFSSIFIYVTLSCVQCTAQCMDIVSNCLDNGVSLRQKEILSTYYLCKASTVSISELTQIEYHIYEIETVQCTCWLNWSEKKKRDQLLFTLWSEMWNMRSLSLQMYCFSCVWCADCWYHFFISHHQQSCDLTSYSRLRFIFPNTFFPLFANRYPFVARFQFHIVVYVTMAFSWKCVCLLLTINTYGNICVECGIWIQYNMRWSVMSDAIHIVFYFSKFRNSFSESDSDVEC